MIYTKVTKLIPLWWTPRSMCQGSREDTERVYNRGPYAKGPQILCRDNVWYPLLEIRGRAISASQKWPVDLPVEGKTWCTLFKGAASFESLEAKCFAHLLLSISRPNPVSLCQRSEWCFCPQQKMLWFCVTILNVGKSQATSVNIFVNLTIHVQFTKQLGIFHNRQQLFTLSDMNIWKSRDVAGKNLDIMT